VWSDNVDSRFNVGIASSEEIAHIAWQDSRNGRAETNSEDVYMASVHLGGTVSTESDRSALPIWVGSRQRGLRDGHRHGGRRSLDPPTPQWPRSPDDLDGVSMSAASATNHTEAAGEAQPASLADGPKRRRWALATHRRPSWNDDAVWRSTP
jgi:hypothetical protein